MYCPQLVLPRVRVQDTGVYVCTATNNFGLAYRQALLSVMGRLLVTGTGAVLEECHGFGINHVTRIMVHCSVCDGISVQLHTDDFIHNYPLVLN